MLKTQTPKTHAATGRQGFTIVEVMIALCIFSLGILGLYAMQVSATNSNAAAGKRTEAVSLAANRLEVLMKAPFASLADDQVTDGGHTIQWTVNPIDINNDAVNDAADILMSVTWIEPGGQKETHFNFIRAQP